MNTGSHEKEVGPAHEAEEQLRTVEIMEAREP